MKKILVSQRIDFINSVQEYRECLDIQLSNLICEIGMIPIPISTSTLKYFSLADYLENIQPDGILLSGGNDIGEVKLRDKLEFQLLSWAILKNTPIFGICRGMQIINVFQGGSISKIKNHVKVRHTLKGIPLFNKKEVNSYHNYHINLNNLGDDLDCLAWTVDDSVEALTHNKYPWMGIMWHPEREKPFEKDDLMLLHNHFKNQK